MLKGRDKIMAEEKDMQYRYIESKSGTDAADEWLRKQKEKKERNQKIVEELGPKLSPSEMVLRAQRAVKKKDSPYASEMPMLPSEYLKKRNEEQEAIRTARLDEIQEVKDARERQSALSRSPQEYKDHRIKSQEKAYKGFLDEAALLGQEGARRGNHSVVEQSTGRREDLGSEALPVYQAMERGKKTEKEAEKRRLELAMRKQNYMTEADRKEYGASPLEEGKPATGGLGELPPSIRARLKEPGRGGESDPEKAAVLDMADTELAIARDDEARRLQRQSESGIEEVDFMANSSVEEQDEVIQKVSEDTDPFSEQTAAAKEDTGRFVRYDGASKNGIMLEKNKLKELFDRKRKMSYLQHVPQENRAALLYNWGLISHKDFTDTQKQSVKELLEIDKLRLQVGELQNKAPKMSDADKAQFTAAANGFQKAVEDRRWDEAQAFSDTLEQIIPGSQAKFNVETVQGKIDDGLKKLPALDKAKAQMGKQVFDGYFNFKNDLIKKIDLVKRSKEGSGDLERLLGATAQAGENKGKTWSDILEGQGYPSWNTVKKFKKGDAKELAKKLSGGKHEDITQIDRASYMRNVLPRIRMRMMENNYGRWHKVIETELHGAQGNKIEELQETINTNSQATARGIADAEDQNESDAIKNAQERDNEIREAEAEELEVMEGVPPQITKLELLERLDSMRQLEKLKERNQKGSRGKGSYGRRGTFTN